MRSPASSVLWEDSDFSCPIHHLCRQCTLACVSIWFETGPHPVLLAWTIYLSGAHAATFAREDGRPPRFLGDPSITMPCSTTPPSGLCQAVAAPTMLPSAQRTTSASENISFRGSITRPGDSLCTLRSQGRPCTTQHSVPAGCQPLPGRLPACRVPLRDCCRVIRYMTFLSSRLCLAHSPRSRFPVITSIKKKRF